MTTSPPRRTPRPLWHSGAPLALLACVWAALVITAPLDGTQGVIQKILYVHPPCAFASYLGFAVTGLFSALYLWKHDDRYDRVALAS
ncbi:MAG: cytochrome C assembly protein, partial [Myxococcota bacterium]